jgi:PhnB protein
MQLNSYLHFNGQCEEAFKFYEKCLGGKIGALIPFDSMPTPEQLPAEWRTKIVHARMTVGEQVLMGMDAAPPHFHQPQGFHVNIGCRDTKEGKRVFDALSENGKVTMPFGPTPWAPGFGMVIDQFGTPWMVNCEPPA